MNPTHKVCNRCHQALPTEFFKEIYKTNGNGEKRLYKNSYCHSCETQRQNEYNKKRGRKAGSVPLDEYRDIRAKAKQERLTRLAEQKAERKKQREIAKEEKAKQRELDRQKRYEEGQAKWDAWHKSFLESGAIEDMKQSFRAEAEVRRKERLASGVRICTKCKEEFPISQFHMRTRKRKDGSRYSFPYSVCKACRRADNRKHEHTVQGKKRKRANAAIRSKRNRQATPSWLTSEQKQDIAAIYEHMRDCKAVTGEDYHVDHIVPLKGETVCGLHVPWNLQVMPAYVNISKSNSLDNTPYGPLEQVP